MALSRLLSVFLAHRQTKPSWRLTRVLRLDGLKHSTKFKDVGQFCRWQCLMQLQFDKYGKRSRKYFTIITKKSISSFFWPFSFLKEEDGTGCLCHCQLLKTFGERTKAAFAEKDCKRNKGPRHWVLLILNQHLQAPGSSVKGDLWFTFDIFYQFFDQFWQPFPAVELVWWLEGREGSLSDRHCEPTIRPGRERKKRREASFAEEKTKRKRRKHLQK